MDPTGIVTFRQGDIGEYLREVWVSISDEKCCYLHCVLGGHSFRYLASLSNALRSGNRIRSFKDTLD
jgi:hypothetical protein